MELNRTIQINFLSLSVEQACIYAKAKLHAQQSKSTTLANFANIQKNINISSSRFMKKV